jgi:hypothetical protein
MIRWPIAGQCVLAACAVMLLCPSFASAQRCSQKAIITSTADLYERPPRFTTGVGWQGNRIAVLSPNTQVYICSSKSVDFGFSSKVWDEVAFLSDRRWQYGWVLEDNITPWHGGLRRGDLGGWSAGMALAAEVPAPPAGEASQWSLGDTPPPAPAPPSASGLASSGVEASSVTFGDLGVLYAPLFVAMLLGMIAKAFVDYLDAVDTRRALKEQTRNGLVAVLVSPIVFLGFLTAGQFGSSKQTFLVLSLLAFQNGFFWQTVLKRDHPSPVAAAASAGGKA